MKIKCHFNFERRIDKQGQKAPASTFSSFPCIKNCIIIQSNQSINGISLFVIKVDENFNFETYHCGIECKIPSLSSNRITTVKHMVSFE